MQNKLRVGERVPLSLSSQRGHENGQGFGDDAFKEEENVEENNRDEQGAHGEIGRGCGRVGAERVDSPSSFRRSERPPSHFPLSTFARSASARRFIPSRTQFTPTSHDSDTQSHFL